MIYFIRDRSSGLIKIGFANEPWKRLVKIQSDTPGVVEMLAIEPGGVIDEARLHRRFAACRSRGEWFFPAPELLAHIDTLAKAEKPTIFSKSRAFWNGMTAAQVARATGNVKSTISNIQNGKRRPSPELAMQLQRVCGISAVWLVFGDDAEEATSVPTPRQASSEAA